jgi:DNA-binding MarR family transcriptional regulator
MASAECGLEDKVNQAALKEVDPWKAAGAPATAGSPNAILPFVRPDSGINGEVVRGICELRRNRNEAFPGKLFSDPTWDIMLQLYAAHLDSLRISIGRLTRLCGVPATTVLRRLGALEDRELVTRTVDRFDARRVFVALSPMGTHAMDECFSASGLRAALL